MNTIFDIALLILIIIQGFRITMLEEEIKAIKSWYPFCEIMKLKIPESEDKE